MEQNRIETFFTKEKGFYTTLFRMMLVLALQNLVAYSINFFHGTAVCFVNWQCTGCTGLTVLGREKNRTNQAIDRNRIIGRIVLRTGYIDYLCDDAGAAVAIIYRHT